MNLIEKVTELRNKVLAFHKESSNDKLEFQSTITIHEADPIEMRKLAKLEGLKHLRFIDVLNKWQLTGVDYNTNINIVVWSKHSKRDITTSDVADKIYETDKTFENEKQYV